jgi:hypothetical protein
MRKDYYNTDREKALRAAQEKASRRSQNLDMAEDLSQVNLIYLNPAQVTVYNYGSRHTTVEAGRGVGKTSGMQAPYMVNCTRTMPRGTFLFLGNSIKQLFTKTVPACLASLEELTGLKEGVHFVRGHAPAKLKFMEPITKPRVWENCIHFWNGAVWYMVSTQVKAAANGMNVCAIADDECRFQQESVIKSEILPALRGIVTNHPGFDEERNPFYRSTLFTSDAPLTRTQGWMRKRMDEQTTDINRQIADMLAEAAVCPDIVDAPRFISTLNHLRTQSYIYFAFSSIENVSILTEEFIRDMKRNLTPTMFDISIVNKEKEEVTEGYYSALNMADIHGYDNSDESQLEAAEKYRTRTVTQIYSAGRSLRVDGESIDLGELAKADDCTMDTDIQPTEPLRIALDYNTNVNGIVTGQTPSRHDSSVLRVLGTLINVKKSRLEGLMEMWCHYYEPHRSACRDVIFYYDSTAKQGASYASERHDETRFYNICKRILKKHGWNVLEVDMGQQMGATKKYELMNACLAGTQRPLIRINRDNNRYLVTSMENCGVIDTPKGFAKDKSKEKYRVPVGADPLEEYASRPDLSDAFDTLVIGTRNYGSGRMMGIGMPLCL